MNDDELDRRFRALREVEPPEALARRTLARVEAERAAESRSTAANTRFPAWAWAAAAALVVGLGIAGLAPHPEVGDPAMMVPKGVDPGPTRTALRLDAAIRQGDTVRRFAAGDGYAAGDTLLFRVTVDRPASLSLLRDGAVLWTGDVPAGSTELPVGWTIEAGAPLGRFEVRAADGSAAILGEEGR